MKFLTLFSVFLVLFFVFFTIPLGYGVYHVEKKFIKDRLSSILDEDSSYWAKAIEEFFELKNSEIIYLSESFYVKDLFNGDSNSIYELQNFYDSKDYINIILINKTGVVLWEGKENYLIGTDISSEEYSQSKISEFFRERNFSNNQIFYAEEGGIEFFMGKGIFEEEKFLGVLIFEVKNRPFERMQENFEEEKSLINVFVIDMDSAHLVPIVENISHDLDEKHMIYFEKKDWCSVKNNDIYLNYNNKEVWGGSKNVNGMSWCIISEIYEENIYNQFGDFVFLRFFEDSLWIYFYLFLGLLIAVLLDKKYKLIRRKIK